MAEKLREAIEWARADHVTYEYWFICESCGERQRQKYDVRIPTVASCPIHMTLHCTYCGGLLRADDRCIAQPEET